MGAESSVQRDGKSQEEDASAAASGGELSAELEVLREEGGGALDTKPLQKNGQISSMSSLNGHSEDNTLAEVGQPDAVSVPQKEEASETVDTAQDEVAPQVNGEKVEKESPDANDISAVEEKAGEEKPDDATEVGFKKIFRFVGFKFTLKKDKSEEKDPVKLLMVKDKEGKELTGTDEPTKEEEAVTAEEKSTAEEKETDSEATTVEAELTDKAETTDAPAGDAANGDTDEAVKGEEAEKEGEASPPSQETTLTLSPFRKLFGGGIFSNLRKKASIKKTKEEEDKEAVVEEEAAKSEETAAAEEDKVDAELGNQEEAPATPEEDKSEPKEEAPVTPEEVKSEATLASEETPAPSAGTSDETKQEEEKAEEEKAPAEVKSEVELLASQEKVKPQGSPLKKLFTGAGLKKLSTKKQKAKKDAESKLTESGEQAAEQLQSSTESAEAPKADSGPSSPEESGEHVLAVEVTQNESSQEGDVEVASDGEKKKEGIIAWSSFKRLVTPKKLVKRSSESDDEATGEKPAKSATLSSSESAPLADKSVEEEATEEKPTEEEPNTENTEKLVSSTEEPKKKMDTSVSWEALMCMGGTKKRTRRTSDSDDEETKIEEEAAAVVESVAEEEEEVKPEAAVVTSASQNTESEGEEVVSSPEPLSPPERESTWDTLKRMVMSKSKPKLDEKPEESANQVQSDSEAPKEESSFSLRKFFPGRRKKKVEKQTSTEAGEEDSDTPAVVPLSEYDDQVEAKQEAPAEIQTNVSTEDRSPSWIPASVEEADNNHDQLSDIPEEAENAATPKSVDTDIADDEDQAMQTNSLGRRGRRLSTAEMKPVTQAPAAEATLVPQGPLSGNAEEVVAGIEAQISEIVCQTSVTVVDVSVEAASENIEDEPPTENAEVTSNTILQPHTSEEAMAICTGLGTKEIAKVALEKPATTLVECMAVVHDVLGTEVLLEEKPASPEEVTVAEDAVFMAQVQQVETTDLEPAVENSQDDVEGIQVATESCEPEIERIGVVTTLLEESVVLQTTTVSENSPKAEVVNPITPTSETAICTQSIEVIEPTVETKAVKMDTELLDAATEENAPITEVFQVVNEEISFTMCSTTMTTITKETVLSSEEAPVITETVVGITPLSVESDQVASSEEVTIKEEETVVETVEATAVEIVKPESPAVGEQATEEMEEIQDDVQQACVIEAQSQVIAQAIIQDAIDKVSETTPEPQEPATAPSPVQATAGIEEEIITENIVTVDTPVAVVCDIPAPKSPPQLHVAMEVIDTIALEVTESLDAKVEEEEKKEQVEELKQAVEVKVSEEETVVVEEVVEGVAEVEKEESQEEEVKPQSEESEENKEIEIHIPVQVVLQSAHLVEEPSVEEEAVVEFDSNGPVNNNISVEPTSPASVKKLSTLSEEAQVTASGEVTEAAADQPETEKTTSGKCAEVMAQVIEVIEEAVKEIEPVSTEITAAS
ncbi:A-kinase anchor protein 12b isoform X1 [Hippoglossus hippoglossus]|uniref:A-kinase anchor protein 12b isoform X1 n=1 Tax=Hippoglossus hippoglossus TaxID=8267 RepID=UPI00148CCF05|nr:A-kinase anchor protein 12b isoform X1 [Hippoglossus hippoglossus]